VRAVEERKRGEGGGTDLEGSEFDEYFNCFRESFSTFRDLLTTSSQSRQIETCKYNRPTLSVSHLELYLDKSEEPPELTF